MRGLQAHLVEQPFHALLCLFAGGHLMHQQRLHDGVADRHARVQRGEWVLEDELDVSAKRLEGGPLQLADVLAGKFDAAALAVHQAQERPSRRRLAAARFADQRQRLTRVEIETDLLHSMHPARNAAEDARGHVKARDEITHTQNGLHIVRRRRLRCRIDRGGRAVHPQQRKAGRAIGALHRAQARHRRQQRTRIRMRRLCKHRGRRALFHAIALVHHEHAVGHFRHYAHVVRDEHHRHVQFLLQRADQLQDFRLDGHVQRGSRLIRNQQRRFA